MTPHSIPARLFMVEVNYLVRFFLSKFMKSCIYHNITFQVSEENCPISCKCKGSSRIIIIFTSIHSIRWEGGGPESRCILFNNVVYGPWRFSPESQNPLDNVDNLDDPK